MIEGYEKERIVTESSNTGNYQSSLEGAPLMVHPNPYFKVNSSSMMSKSPRNHTKRSKRSIRNVRENNSKGLFLNKERQPKGYEYTRAYNKQNFKSMKKFNPRVAKESPTEMESRLTREPQHGS